MKNKTRIILAIILGILIGSMASYGYGFAKGIQFSVGVGYKVLEESGVDFSLEAQQIADLIETYKNEFEVIGGDGRTAGEIIIQNSK